MRTSNTADELLRLVDALSKMEVIDPKLIREVSLVLQRQAEILSSQRRLGRPRGSITKHRQTEGYKVAKEYMALRAEGLRATEAARMVAEKHSPHMAISTVFIYSKRWRARIATENRVDARLLIFEAALSALRGDKP